MKRGAKVIKLKDIVDDALARASDSGHALGEYLSGRSQLGHVMVLLEN